MVTCFSEKIPVAPILENHDGSDVTMALPVTFSSENITKFIASDVNIFPETIASFVINRNIERSPRQTNARENLTRYPCSHGNPCGFWPYEGHARRVLLDYVESICYCPDGIRCLRYSDNINLRMYVFRCNFTNSTLSA
ncbi:hypothetical protein NPIL_697041 [Nephila pilipes]|uniref:Uncharacterized protein n=1 Tax=Nephila pilipes TaxID=299642 RepID=A0A8X6QBM5_NEPPI|nr:hypothetical protein NPIL_697041 [Nephila pilipes]